MQLKFSLTSFVKSALVAACLCTAAPAVAQNLFAPIARVNDGVITEFEVQQRQRFLQLLNAPGTSREDVIDALIDDRLKDQEVRSLGASLTQEELAAGMEEFASRANLTADEFIKALGQSGVDAETFREFVRIGIAWRGLIRARFGGRAQITEDQIDRALASSGAASGLRVLMSEIIIPAPPQRAARVQALAEEISLIKSESAFSAAARKYSATASRGRGGRLDWVPVGNLPPALRPLLLALAPGEVTAPINIPNAVALFQLRAIEETNAPEVSYVAIEYAAYYIPGGRSDAALAEANRLRNTVDVCDDLYGIAKGQPEEVLERGAKQPGDIPRDIAFELAKLDPGEVSTTLTRANGETLVFLMLCGRTAEANEDVSRDAVSEQLRQRRLTSFSDGLVAQLRADAHISRQ